MINTLDRSYHTQKKNENLFYDTTSYGREVSVKESCSSPSSASGTHCSPFHIKPEKTDSLILCRPMYESPSSFSRVSRINNMGEDNCSLSSFSSSNTPEMSDDPMISYSDIVDKHSTISTAAAATSVDPPHFTITHTSASLAINQQHQVASYQSSRSLHLTQHETPYIHHQRPLLHHYRQKSFLLQLSNTFTRPTHETGFCMSYPTSTDIVSSSSPLFASTTVSQNVPILNNMPDDYQNSYIRQTRLPVSENMYTNIMQSNSPHSLYPSSATHIPVTPTVAATEEAPYPNLEYSYLNYNRYQQSQTEIGYDAAFYSLMPQKQPICSAKKEQKAHPTHHNHYTEPQQAKKGNQMITQRPTKTTSKNTNSKRERTNRKTASSHYPCLEPNCNKTFSRPYNLKSHMRTHTHERPYECSHKPCAWRFARPHDLKRHELQHTGLKPHSCRFCFRKFARSDALKRHWKVDSYCSEALKEEINLNGGKEIQIRRRRNKNTISSTV